MEKITLGQIGTVLAFLATLITSVGVIYAWLSKKIDKSFQTHLDPLYQRMDETDKRIKQVDNENCKNYLVTFLSDMERGKEPEEIELKRFYEQYDHYTENGGNSYIKHKVEKHKADGKL